VTAFFSLIEKEERLPPPPVGGGQGEGEGQGNPPHLASPIKGEEQNCMRKRLTQRAKILRQQSTEAEKLLWRYLRGRQLEGAKFRRQQPIGKYNVDFISFSHKLIVEVDGGQHAQPREQVRDRQRDAWLREQGFTVVRFWNNQVLRNVEGAIEAIRSNLLRSDTPT
jgi:very-short-patch-repair endonuclease